MLTGTKLNDSNVEEAKLNELRKWKEHEVYQEVENEGQPLISTRWVCTEKDSGKGKIIKARLVARGSEEDNSNIRRDSPTCCKESLRLALVVIASNHWEVNSLDIQSAFLQGSRISRDLFIKPPPEACTTKIWKLQKCVYGLVDASRLWYLRVTEELKKLGATKRVCDEVIFYYHHNGNWKVLSQHMLMIFSGVVHQISRKILLI